MAVSWQSQLSRLATSGLRASFFLYRHSLSYFLGRQCRFHPSCSVYADEAVRVHGPVRGLRLTVTRLCRCRPGGGHGFDPVPPPNRDS